ncbi:MAG TPA: DUF885 domain-containing protein [Dongiaceae bacterium]|nr:DUF885 domain-containing protein [Dongiaceae bacterium]
MRKASHRVVWICLLLAIAAPSNFAQQESAEQRRKALADLLTEQWEYTMRTSPVFASMLGDKRWNDKLEDVSQAAIDKDIEATEAFLRRFEAIDITGFPPQEAMNKKLMVRNLKMELEGARFKPWEMPVSQFGGVHIELPDMVNVLSFETVKDYEDYVARLKAMPLLFEQTEIQMRKGLAEGLMPPKYLLEKVVEQSNRVSSASAEKTPFARPFDKYPSGIPAADQKRLREAGLAAIRDGVIPAYQKFAKFVREEYAPKGRTEPGLWALPDGGERYRFAVKEMTTTDMNPEAIHQLGLQQVDTIEKEMLAIANKLGYKDIASLNGHIKTDRKFYATSGQQVLDLYRGYTDDMGPELPKLFGRLPKNKLEVIPMEASREKDAVPADYTGGAADGSRPGHINVNEYDPEHRLTLNIEAIAYHEGIPGHHLQISIGQELGELPAFRRNGGYTAFVEGWALYSEQLGKEVGRYQDPYSNYGRLENEMWRAIRLVVDTGVHEKRWSREQMVEYFHKYTAMDEPNVQTEVDRYIAWPGQALAYKLGQLEILKLRERAKKQMGDKFDIRAFHDEVLGNGALPLDVLDEEVTGWMNGKK